MQMTFKHNIVVSDTFNMVVLRNKHNSSFKQVIRRYFGYDDLKIIIVIGIKY